MKDGALDRGYMAPLVFSDPKKLQKLNRIAHKHVKAELKKLFAGFGAEDIVLLDAPTLFESGLDSECDLIISVIAPEEACLERIIERDGIGREAALMRLVNQPDDDFFIEHGDIVVYNDGTPEEFAEAAGEIIGSIVRDGI